MPHAAHALLVLATAILLAGAGIVVLALAWRRRYRGERSAMVVGTLTARQQLVTLLGVPVGGLTGILAITVIAAALR